MCAHGDASHTLPGPLAGLSRVQKRGGMSPSPATGPAATPKLVCGSAEFFCDVICIPPIRMLHRLTIKCAICIKLEN